MKKINFCIFAEAIKQCFNCINEKEISRSNPYVFEDAR